MTIVAHTLIAFGALLCVLNWGTLIANWRYKRFVSAVPFVGALPLGWGMSLLPGTRPYAWLALVADYGTLVFIIALPRILLEVWSTSRVNLLHCFTGNSAGRAIAIKLYRRNVAAISADFDPPFRCDDHGGLVLSFGMAGTWAATESGFLIKGYDSDRQLLLSQQSDGGFATMESNYPSGKEYSYDSLDRLLMRERL